MWSINPYEKYYETKPTTNFDLRACKSTQLGKYVCILVVESVIERKGKLLFVSCINDAAENYTEAVCGSSSYNNSCEQITPTNYVIYRTPAAN